MDKALMEDSRQRRKEVIHEILPKFVTAYLIQLGVIDYTSPLARLDGIRMIEEDPELKKLIEQGEEDMYFPKKYYAESVSTFCYDLVNTYLDKYIEDPLKNINPDSLKEYRVDKPLAILGPALRQEDSVYSEEIRAAISPAIEIVQYLTKKYPNKYSEN